MWCSEKKGPKSNGKTGKEPVKDHGRPGVLTAPGDNDASEGHQEVEGEEGLASARESFTSSALRENPTMALLLTDQKSSILPFPLFPFPISMRGRSKNRRMVDVIYMSICMCALGPPEVMTRAVNAE